MPEWVAQWIWDDSGPAPRNYYLEARRSFELSAVPDHAELHCTADSRYVLFVNGARVGTGPVRGWAANWHYDSYDVTSLLRPGENVLAVLVLQPGESNFQYVLGRGGLVGQLEADGVLVATDEHWRVRPSPGFSRRTPRISCQQAFATEFDARLEDSDWTAPGYDDSGWGAATVVGPVGCTPWTNLRPRPIPFLTDEPIYPQRVISSTVVREWPHHVTLHLAPALYPGKTDSNPRVHRALLATVVRSPSPGEARSLFAETCDGNPPVMVDGRRVDAPGGWTTVPLSAGDNLLVVDISRVYHHMYVTVSADGPEGLSFRAPGAAEGAARFAAIGPCPEEGTHAAALASATEAALLEASGPLLKFISPDDECPSVWGTTVTAEPVGAPGPGAAFEALCWANDNVAAIEPVPAGQATELLVDFGRELVGPLEFEVWASEGTVLDFHLFESIQEGRRQWPETTHNTLRYTCRQGWQQFRGIVRQGFRYAAVHIRSATAPTRIRRLMCRLNTYPVARRGSFECSDDRLTRIYELCAHTTRLCSEDTYVDCPLYEQTFWVGDARNESLVSYTTSGAYDLARRCLELVPESMFRSPIPESQTPSGWQNLLTAWSLFWGWACEEYYIYTGDREFARRIYPQVRQMLDNLLAMRDARGLLSIDAWNMLDWAPMDTPGSGAVTHNNAELAACLRAGARLAEIAGRPEDAPRFVEAAEALATAMNAHLWDGARGAYVDCLREDGSQSPVLSQQTNTVCYLCGVVPESRRAAVEAVIREAPEGFVRIGSPFMMFFAFEALAQLGEYQRILNWTRQWWGLMLDCGATSCWEVFPGFDPRWYTRSHCHAWSAGPGYFLPTYQLGVRPDAPGFAHARIEPIPADLSWARGRVPTPAGEIEVGWRRSDGRFRIEVALPPGTAAMVVLPFGTAPQAVPPGAEARCVSGKWEVELPSGGRGTVEQPEG